MPEHRNFKAWILCDGKPLQELGGASDPNDERVYTCWVASEAGKSFTIRWESLMKGVCDNLGLTFVDGVEADGHVDFAKKNDIPESAGVKADLGEVRPYVFSPTTLTDDESYLDMEQSSDLGTVALTIFLVNAYRKNIARPRSRRSYRESLTLYEGPIHERAKKICDHRVMLGDAAPSRRPFSTGPKRSKILHTPYDPDDSGPHVTFRFNYRPISYLQAKGLLPVPVAFNPTPQKPLFLEEVTVPGSGEQGRKRKRALSEQSSSQKNILQATPVKSDFTQILKQTKSTRKLVLDQEHMSKRVKVELMTPIKAIRTLLKENMDVIDLTELD